MKKLILILFLLLLPATLSAQNLAGTLTWTHTRPADIAKYTVTVDGGSAIDLGLPATNTAPLTLATGSHTLVLSACYQDLQCAPDSAFVVDAQASAPLQYTSLTPADGFSVQNNHSVTMSVTATDNSGIGYVKMHWTNGSTTQILSTVKNGNVYTYTTTPTAGAGTRHWFFEIKAVDGEIVNTPNRLLNVTP